MNYKSGYEIVVGVRLVPARAPACVAGSTKISWSETLKKRDRGFSSVFVTESRGIPYQSQTFQELLDVVQPFDSPSTGLRTVPRTLPVKPFEPEMVLIPAGEFTMGGDPGLAPDEVDDEQHQHTLYLPDYYLARTPVTNAQYAAFVRATGHHLPERWLGKQPPIGKEHYPVVYVSWHDATAYCQWLAEETGKPYRLPIEAEWEKGARDSDGRIYLWDGQGDGKRHSTAGGKRGARPVGTLPQGVIPHDWPDMAGNVWEWTRSVWKIYPGDPENGREDIKSGVGRVLRGGSWYRNQWYARCTLRYSIYPDARYHYIGFRVAASPDSP